MKTPGDPDQAAEQQNEQSQLLECQAAYSDIRMVGPIAIGPNTHAVRLMRGEDVLGELDYWPQTRTGVSITPRRGPAHDLLARYATEHGLLLDKDVPDHLQHDQEQL